MSASRFFLLFLVIILCQIFSDVIVVASYEFYFQLWYHLSKTLAEEAAWKFAEECGIDLVVINPGFVIGPVIQPTPTSSIDEFLKLVNGTLL
jgi:nucleoside-diphosphate-sugar epimerase